MSFADSVEINSVVVGMFKVNPPINRFFGPHNRVFAGNKDGGLTAERFPTR